MKKFCALFVCAFFIIAQNITYVPVKAVGTTVDFGEMLNEYLNVAEVGLALSQGASIDWSDLDIPEELETDQEKAKYIVNYLGALRHTGIQAIYDWMFNGENDNPYLQNVSAIGLSTTSGIGANGTQDIRSQLADVLALNNGKHIIQRYNDSIIARWNEYNTNYINDYLDIMDQTETITYPDNINRVNVGTFYANNLTGGHTTVSAIGYYENGFSYRPSFGDGSETTFTGLKYPFVYRCLLESAWSYFDVVGYQVSGINQVNNYNKCFIPCDSINPTIISEYPIFYDLNSALNYSRTGSVISGGGITVSLPDAVIDSGTDDGKIVAHPIYYPDTVKNGGTISIDLDTLNDIIAQKVADGDTSITMDDVIDAGAVIDADGTTLTDADTNIADVSIPIAKAGALDIATNPSFPNLNIIPPLPILPDINSNDANVGFQGMSVLARIINVTVQSCPEPLIMTFFGVIFGVVILGIIKILHH